MSVIKDRKQGLLLLNAVAEAIPHYLLDQTFAAELPTELLTYFENWEKGLQKLG